MKIGIIIPMPVEVPDRFSRSYEHALSFENKVQEYHCGKKDIFLIISGVCIEQSKENTGRLIQTASLDYLLCLGFCGSNERDLHPGQLVLANSVKYFRKKIDLSNSRYFKQIQKNAEKYFLSRIGKLQTFNYPLKSRQGVPEEITAVDMESFAIAEQAQKYNIPLVIVRSVSDQLPLKGTKKRLEKEVKKNTGIARQSLNRFIDAYLAL